MNEEREVFDDELLRLVGEGILADATSPIWKDERFLGWLRSRAAGVVDASRQQALIGRSYAAAHGARLVREAPPVRHDRAADAKSGRRPRVAPRFDQSVAAGIGRELWEETAEEWVELPDDVAGGDFLALRITGDSMTPVIHAGDTVLLRRGSRVMVGSVIVARDPANGYICKRVRRVDRRTLKLESIAEGHGTVELPNDRSLVLGTVLMVWCDHGG